MEQNNKENLDTKLDNEEIQENGQQGQEAEQLEEEVVNEESVSDLISVLKNKNEKLANEQEALKERMLRLTAEYDNYRKRTAKEKEGIYTDACEDVLKNILPVLDNLERAVAIEEGSFEDLKKGIEITIKQFKEALTKLNVEEIATDGEFDPNFHNAVMHIEDDSFGKNEVAEVFMKGYKRGDKVIRFSMVKVAN